MNTILLNQTLQLSVPESFHEMSQEETAMFRRGHSGEGICMKSAEEHMIISIAWKKQGGLFSRLLGSGDLVADMERCYKKSFKPYGYVPDGKITRQVAGETADGIRYKYHVQEIEMTGESSVLRKDGILYYLHVYYRSSLNTECQDHWNAILDTADFLY